MSADLISQLENLLGVQQDNVWTLSVHSQLVRDILVQLRTERDELQAKCKHQERALRYVCEHLAPHGWDAGRCPPYDFTCPFGEKLDSCREEQVGQCYVDWGLEHTAEQPEPDQE